MLTAPRAVQRGQLAMLSLNASTGTLSNIFIGFRDGYGFVEFDVGENALLSYSGECIFTGILLAHHMSTTKVHLYCLMTTTASARVSCVFFKTNFVVQLSICRIGITYNTWVAFAKKNWRRSATDSCSSCPGDQCSSLV